MATYPAATWRPGPRSKQGGYAGITANACAGVICHSTVGSLAGAMARLDNIDKDEHGRFTPQAAASWQFTVCKDGRVLQHYDTAAVCWHAGSPYWNGRLIGLEHEGGPADEEFPLGSPQNNPSEPLTPEQLQSSVNLVRWLSFTHNFPLVRFNGLTGGLFEHRQVYATACPSGRIPWAEYVEEPMTDEERRKFEVLTAAVFDHARWIQGLNEKGNGTFGLALRNQARIDALESKGQAVSDVLDDK